MRMRKEVIPTANRPATTPRMTVMVLLGEEEEEEDGWEFEGAVSGTQPESIFVSSFP
jgi:hypothetical protein